MSRRPYDFVPYKYGAFSFTSYADRRKLIEGGLLVVGIALAVSRDEFDIARHPLSLFMLGDTGWIQALSAKPRAACAD